MGESTMSEILITGPPRIRELVDQLKAKGAHPRRYPAHVP
jgi:hypothetical protein